MPKLYLKEAVGLLMKTLPFLWVRLGSYAGLGVGLVFYFAVIGAVAWLLSFLWGGLGVIVFIAGFGGAFWLVRLAMRYYFYMLDAAHASVMTEFIIYGKGPEDGQLAHGKEQVMSRFRDTSILFLVDRMVDGAVRSVTRSVANVFSILPMRGMDGLKKFFQRVAKYSSKFIDKAILSRAYSEREPNVWKVAQDGVILYAQCWKPILANAVVLTLLSYVEFFIFLALLGIPAVALGAMIGIAGINIALGVFVIVGAWMLKLAVADAFGMAATLLAYHRTTADMEPNPEWKARLEKASDQFRQLRDKAIKTGEEWSEHIEDGEAQSNEVVASPELNHESATSGGGKEELPR